MRKDRVRAKKGSFKFSPDQIEWVMNQKGVLSVRETRKAFARRYHYIHHISIGMISGIWNGKYHKDKKCSSCGVIETKCSPFTISKDRCDSCYNLLQKTLEAAKKREHLNNLIKEVKDIDGVELIDLPLNVRQKLIKDKTFDLTSEDLFRPQGKNRLLSSDPSVDPANKDAWPAGQWAGAVYAIYFVGEPGLEDKVYVGLTTSGVMKRFQIHLSDCRTRKKITCGNGEYKRILKRLQKENKHHCIRIQLLENNGFADEDKEEWSDITQKEKMVFLELLEQKWQQRFFLSEWTMLNASFKINTKLKLIQDSIRENMRRWLENPESHNIKDISKVGIGTYVPRKVSQGWTWDFNALGEEAYESSPYAGGTALESEPPEESEETVEEMPDWLL